MDLTPLLSQLPQTWLGWTALALAVASGLDYVVPQVSLTSRWAKPRAILHVLGQNYDKAAPLLRSRP